MPDLLPLPALANAGEHLRPARRVKEPRVFPLARTEVLAFFANLPRGLIGLEACGGADCWARELSGLGHERPLDLIDGLAE